MFNGALVPKQKPPVNKPTPPKKEVPVKTVDSLGGYNDKYLRKENYLGEYLSDKEKAIVRDNLGINVGDLLQYVKDLAEQEITGGSPRISINDLYNNTASVRSILRNSPTGNVIIEDGNSKYSGKINYDNEQVQIALTVNKDEQMVDYILHLFDNNMSMTNTDFIEYK